MVLRTGTGNEVVDYAQPEMANEQSRVAVQTQAFAPARAADPSFDYLDIPAFLATTSRLTRKDMVNIGYELTTY